MGSILSKAGLSPSKLIAKTDLPISMDWKIIIPINQSINRRKSIAMIICLYWCQGACENDPGQDRFWDQAKNDISSLAKQIIFPGSYLFILQHHVDREDIEEYKQGRVNDVYKSWGTFSTTADRAEEIQENYDPGDNPGNASVDEGNPIGFLCVLVVIFHHDTKQVHRGVDTKDQNDGTQIP